MMETKKIIPIGKKKYEVTYPTVGQTLEIESMKIMISGGTYGELVRSSHKTATDLLNLIDGVSYFSILIPKFKDDFNIEDFMTIDLQTQNQIKNGFIVFWKWFQSVNQEINTIEDDESENGKGQQE